VKRFFRSKWFWLAAGILLIAAVIQWGGKTIVVMNSAYKDICEVHVSYHNDQTNWGPNRISSRIVWPNSRDIHLPIYFNWSKAAGDDQLNLWAVDCSGNVINTAQFDARRSFITWQVSRKY